MLCGLNWLGTSLTAKRGIQLQTKKSSLLEASLNVASGYVISVVAGKLIYPLFGLPVSNTQLTGITAVFTAIGVVRSFFWRRLFNWLHHK